MKLDLLVKCGDVQGLGEILRSISILTDYLRKWRRILQDIAIKKIGKIHRKIEIIEEIECGKSLQFGRIWWRIGGVIDG